jgi:RimJ/RimL family protein N-acetyltransferase
MAISSAGTTTWELLFLGIPSLFLILADNQSPIGKQIQSQKAGKTLGWAKDIPTRRLADSITELANDLELRTEMVASARQMVDGLGVHRVVHKMQQRQVARLKLRQVNSTDFDTLLDWANETTVRAYSFSSDPITETEHANWLNGKFNDPNCIFYIIENNRSEPIGQIRFDIDNAGNAEISTSIDVKNRNKGYASSAIELACQRIIQLPHVKKILAYIKQENTASIRTFANADFAFKELIEFKGHAAFEMTWPI